MWTANVEQQVPLWRESMRVVQMFLTEVHFESDPPQEQPSLSQGCSSEGSRQTATASVHLSDDREILHQKDIYAAMIENIIASHKLALLHLKTVVWINLRKETPI